MRSFESKKKISLLVLIAAAILFCRAGALYAAATAADLDKQIKQQEQQYDKIQKQISTTQKKLSETQKQEKTVVQQVETLSQKITLTQQKVNVTTLNVQKVQGNISDLTKKIAETNKNIEHVQDKLSHRFVAIYKYGGVAEFNLLMSSQGAQDALSNSYLLGKIAEQDEALINQLISEKNELEKAQQELQSEKTKLEGQVKNLSQQQNQLKGEADERNALLAKVRKDKALYMAEQAELLKASKELQNTIKTLLAEKKRLAQQKNPGQKETVYYRGGKLAWPLPIAGKITSTFGTRVHPVFKTKTTHTGVDISAPHGTAVNAADAGEILYTGWLKGYGQVVIVDHGANLTTVYAHLSKIETSEGTKVKRGQLIGRVGSTGVATGNHLHFETRVNGEAVNPMRYLQ
ncbi:peptidoglycan DD-metalloendopeptidase family protein [Synergistaceae bacterium OttesenSCG-928-D05]|nr:peptidoglycan DD-metalloendopeptidase family protein [Synergistaceae bacterium OttesenSCG-928-D05]